MSRVRGTENTPAVSTSPKLRDQVRDRARVKHYIIRTETQCLRLMKQGKRFGRRGADQPIVSWLSGIFYFCTGGYFNVRYTRKLPERRRAKRSLLQGGEGLHLHHLKIRFSHVAIRADPVIWYIFPPRAGRNTFFGEAQCFVVNEVAGDTSPSLRAIVLFFR